jgi:D-lactate dehydrogenase
MNSYHTLKSIRFILPDGKTFNTEVHSDYKRFLDECTVLADELTLIRKDILSNTALFNKIRSKYQTKNTVGYSLNAFIDHEHPLDIMAHLLIGAEGTLAFISEAVLNTIPNFPHKSTALLYFPDIYSACNAIIPLTEAGAMMVELMDRASLRSVENLPGMPDLVKSLSETAASLLIEFQEETAAKLDARVDYFLASSASLKLINAPVFTTDEKQQDFLWQVRKGLFPAVGAVRKSGTTVVLEDLAFPVSKLGDAILDLQELFKIHEYHNAIIFGHAKDGNIHFVVTQSFNTPEEIERYDRFLRDVVELTVHKYDGTLKAEHGTGRNMAPFVETEWGGEAYEIIRRIKRSVDPAGLLNPGVIINDDSNAHIRNLKEMPSVEDEVDRCIECGYCEHKCPSRDITTTPRRRIVIRRILKQLENSGNRKEHELLLKQYQYEGLDTCALDGLCATACPVDINTGDLVKRLRRENHSRSSNQTALWVARHFETTLWAVRAALKGGSFLNSLFGRNTMYKLTQAFRKIAPALPIWSNELPSPPSLKVLTKVKSDNPSIVYFPSCISRAMGSYSGRQKNVMETFLSVCEKSGFAVQVINDVNSACCSQIFSSKGYSDAHRYQANKIVSQLWASTEGGRLPVVIDISSCAYTLRHLRPALDDISKKKFDLLQILDSVEFLHDMIIPKANVKMLSKKIVLHPVCSLQKMNTQEKFITLAKQLTIDVVVPLHAGCCGMAGDRGFLFPELTASATRAEAIELAETECDGYFSSTKTCEMAMSAALSRDYESILYLADEAIV